MKIVIFEYHHGTSKLFLIDTNEKASLNDTYEHDGSGGRQISEHPLTEWEVLFKLHTFLSNVNGKVISVSEQFPDYSGQRLTRYFIEIND